MATNNQLLQQIAGADRDGLTNNQLLQVIADNGGGGGGGSNAVASSLEDKSTRVWVPDEMNVNSGVIMIGRTDDSEYDVAGVYTVEDMEIYSNVGVDGEGEWSPCILLYGASGKSGNLRNEIRLNAGNSGSVRIEAGAGLLLTLNAGQVALSLAEGAAGHHNFSFPGVENGQIVVSTDPPATASSPGFPGQRAYDSSYLYICVAADTWKRTPLSSW